MSNEVDAKDRLIRNERIKLTSAYLNAVAGSLTLAGVIAPAASLFYTANAAASPYWAAFVLCWLVVAVAVGVHITARILLGRLTP